MRIVKDVILADAQCVRIGAGICGKSFFIDDATAWWRYFSLDDVPGAMRHDDRYARHQALLTECLACKGAGSVEENEA
jgi:hypothetical protein